MLQGVEVASNAIGVHLNEAETKSLLLPQSVFEAHPERRAGKCLRIQIIWGICSTFMS